MFLLFILILLSINPLLAINSIECDKCISPEYGTARMKRHGGGKGGAKSRGVLRDDKGGGATTAAAKGGATTAAAKGGATTAAAKGGATTAAAKGGATTAAGGGTTFSAPPAGVVNSSKSPFGDYDAKASGAPMDPKKLVMSHFPAIGKDRNCECIFETDEAPLTAIILYRSSGNLLCLGSIVDRLHILTSKRCLSKVEAGDLRVVVGCFKAWWGQNSQVMKVRKIIRHELEAALLWLKTEISFTEFVQPARLPSSSLKWKPENEPGIRIDKDNYYLLRGDKFVSLKDCKEFYSVEKLEDKLVFCTMGNSTYCWGGWGAPILFWQGEYFIQIGFVIADCCAANETGPYLAARTDYYGEWINGLVYNFHKPT